MSKDQGNLDFLLHDNFNSNFLHLYFGILLQSMQAMYYVYVCICIGYV